MSETNHRQALKTAHRVVIKVGTRVLVDSRGRPRPDRIQAMVTQIAALKSEGREVVLVSSGAVGAGLDPLGFARRPTALVDLQMAAAVGQNRLMRLYSEQADTHRIAVAQVLLNHDDLKNRTRHLNARNTLMGLLTQGCLPIVNENDVVSVDEIRLGDNDTLASLVSVLVDADALILCTSVNGLREPGSVANRTQRVSYLSDVTADALALASGKGSDLSTGGMATKLEAARMATRTGIATVIVDGRRPDSLVRACAGDDIGTLIGPMDGGQRVRGKRKHWIAFFHKPCGTLQVDAGARTALMEDGKSLLAAGIRSCSGRFKPGDVVEVLGPDGNRFATGLTEFSHTDVEVIRGCKSGEIIKRLGPAVSTEVIHRDNLALHAD